MHTIDLIEARTAALKALEEVGDHVYEKPVSNQADCSYTTPDGAPSCIVGFVVYKTDPQRLPRINRSEWSGAANGADLDSFSAIVLNECALGDEDAQYTHVALDWLQQAQNLQDHGALWSVAIATADEGTARDFDRRQASFGTDTRATKAEAAYIKAGLKEAAK